MSRSTINNNFLSGMIQDSLEKYQVDSSYRFAKNAVHKSREAKGFGLTNEESNVLRAQFGTIVGGLYVESMDATVIFHTEGGASNISLVDHKNGFKRVDIATDAEFGCDWKFSTDCQWINPTVKTMQPCNETYIYWSAGCEYFVANLSELRDPVRKASLIACIKGGEKSPTTCGYSCEHFKLFKCVCTPNMSLTAQDNGGHNLENGIYQFAVQLEDNAGSTTNWSFISNKLSIGSINNIAGEFSQQSVRLDINDLDCKYDKVNIAVVKTISGVTSTELAATRHFSSQGITFTYTGQVLADMDITEITVKRKTYIKGRELIQKDGRLWLYKVKQEKNINMQARILAEAKLEFTEFIYSATVASKHNIPSLERGEGYLPAIVYKYCDNTYSPAFLMSTTGAGASTSAGTQEDSTNAKTSIDPNITRDIETPASGAAVGTVSSTGDYVEPTSTSEGKFIRTRKKSGLIGPCLEGEDCNQDPTFPQIDDTDTIQDGVLTNVDAMATDHANVVQAAKCDDCEEPGCCVDDGSGGTVFEPAAGSSNCEGCNEDEDAIEADLPKAGDILNKHVDELSHMAEAGTEQTKDKTQFTSTTIKESAQRLISAVEDKPSVERTANKRVISNAATGSSNYRGARLANSWSDDFTYKGKSIIEEQPAIGASFAPGLKNSTEIYPDGKDCEGNFLYGTKANQPVEIFMTPTADQSPIIRAGVSGVPSQESPNVDAIYENDIVCLGITVTGVPIPSDEELPKPLCPNEPYKIVMVPRDETNSTVQAKGILTSTFTGVSNGKTRIFGRHGLCSKELYDRFINDDGSHVGTDSGSTVYNFHSLDANTLRAPLTGETLRIEGRWQGQGYRYGMYSKGEDPELPLTGRRLDQRGTRSAININSFDNTLTGEFNILGLTYAAANSNVKIPNTDFDLSNRFRESNVAIALDSQLPGSQEDKSFTADGYNHTAPIKNAHAWYGAIVRDIEDQYGSVEGLRFIDTGVTATSNTTSVRGVCGDVFIGPHTFRRTGYVSNKVGDTYPTPERDRTVCDSPETAAAQDSGLGASPIEIPNDSDITDAKNWANAYSGTGTPLLWEAAADAIFTGVDIYYPKLTKTLIISWGEHRVNPWMRATGIGPGKVSGEVFYPMLKELELDSNGPTQTLWPDAYLNRIFYELKQPSKEALIKKALIKNIVDKLIPLIGFAMFLGGTDSVTGTVSFIAALPMLIAFWYFSEQILASDDLLNNKLGIPSCITDATGFESDGNIKGFEDNHYRGYNYDHSRLNYQNYYQSMPGIYNTCDCDDCLDQETTNEVYFSNKQVNGSNLDYYKNFKALNYLEIGADHGKLNKLFNLNGNFFAHTTDGILLIKYNAITTQTSIGNALIGGGDMVIEPFNILEGVIEGFAGLSHTNSSVVTKHGYIFVDEEANKVYQFTGQVPKEISKNGLESFFKKNLKYCSETECKDTKEDGTNYISIGYDPRYDRIMLTKADGEGGNSITMSYDPEATVGKWVSMHDYIPQAYFWDRATMLSTKDGAVYEHNIKGEYLKFYDSKETFEVELVASSKGIDFNAESTTVRLETNNGSVNNIDEFFRDVAIFNSNQGSGTRRVFLEGDNAGDRENAFDGIEETAKLRVVKLSKNKYRFNEIHDNTIATCTERAMVIEDDCKWKDEINEGVFDCDESNSQTFGNRILQDDYITYRMTYTGDNRIKLIQVSTTINQTDLN